LKYVAKENILFRSFLYSKESNRKELDDQFIQNYRNMSGKLSVVPTSQRILGDDTNKSE